MRHPVFGKIHPGLLIVLALGLSGCSLFQKPVQTAPEAVVSAPLNPMSALGTGVTAASLDTTTEAEKAAALNTAPDVGERTLGTVTVALGSPTEPGFWIKTALVSVAARGRVETADGKSVAVDLIPFDGAALLSFAAFRALDLPLTDLPDVTVFAE